MKRSMTRRITTVALAGALALGTIAAPALAQDDVQEDTRTPSEKIGEAWDEARERILQAIKDHAQAAVDRRVETLGNLTDWVNRNEHVTDAHSSSLLADYTAAETGLLSLNEDIQVATTIEDALKLSEKIASDFRVYLVIVPKTAGVIVGDSMVAVTDRLDGAFADVQDAVDRLDEAGYDVTDVQASLDAAQAHADTAADVAGAVPSTVIDLDATDWPDPAESTLEGARADLESAGNEIRSAGEDLKAAIEGIRDLLGSDS